MTDNLAELIENRLGIRGKTLEVKLKRAGRLLPRDVRRNIDVLLQAAKLDVSPKLKRQIDDRSVQRAYDTAASYLSQINAWDRRAGRMIGLLSTNAFNVVVLAAIVIAVLVWRDLI